MKNIQLLTLIAALSAFAIHTRADDAPAANPAADPAAKPAPEPAAKPATDAATAPETPNAPPIVRGSGAVVENTTAATNSGPVVELGTNALHLNFRGASLETVLNYLSEAAGFIINVKPGTSIRGKVDLWSADPLTREEVLNALDTVLNQNNLAAIRNGRTLSIVNRDEAKTQNIPVIQGSNPKEIPITDKIVTQIIPVRFVEVGTLIKDLQPLVSMQTTMTANEAGNAIVMTDTQANIRKVSEIINAIDMGAEEFTEVRVFHLSNSDPTEIADTLSNLFPDDSRSGSSQSPITMNPFFSRFGGGGRFGGFGRGGTPGGGNTTGGSDQNQRIKKRNRVIAVADQRTTSVIVSASKDLMDQISEVVTALDENPKGRVTVKVFRLENADPQETLPVLQDIFQRSGTQNSRNSANQNGALQNRSNTQNQQNNSNTRSSFGGNTGGRGGGGPAFQ